MNHSQKNDCGKPITIWEHNLFESSTYIYPKDIKCKTISLIDKLNDTYGTVLFISPYQ